MTTATMDIKGAASQAKAAHQRAYWTMLQRRAKGEEVDPGECLAAIEAADKTPEVWDRDLGQLTERTGYAADLAAGEKVSRESAKIETRRAAEVERFAKLQVEHERILVAMDDALDVLRSKSHAAEDAPGRLRATASVSLRGAIDTLRARAMDLEGTRDELRRKASRVRWEERDRQEQEKRERNSRSPFRKRPAGQEVEQPDPGAAEAQAMTLERRADDADSEARRLTAEADRLQRVAEDPLAGLLWSPEKTS